jgi:hypothetical protein
MFEVPADMLSWTVISDEAKTDEKLCLIQERKWLLVYPHCSSAGSAKIAVAINHLTRIVVLVWALCLRECLDSEDSLGLPERDCFATTREGRFACVRQQAAQRSRRPGSRQKWDGGSGRGRTTPNTPTRTAKSSMGPPGSSIDAEGCRKFSQRSVINLHAARCQLAPSRQMKP